MAHVVTEKCNGCKFTDCVEVCPVTCFYELDNQLVIHPEECIDCTACVDVCPVHAIYAEADLPSESGFGPNSDMRCFSCRDMKTAAHFKRSRSRASARTPFSLAVR